MPTYETVGVIEFRTPAGVRTGCVDVCREDNGDVVVRMNRLGHEVIVIWPPGQARRIAALVAKAAADAPDVPTV